MASNTANLLSVLVFLLVGSVLRLCVSGETLEIPVLEREPKIDGELDPAEWARAARFAEFRETAEKRQSDVVPPGLRTEAWLARTAAGLCVAFRCYHDQMSQMVTAVKTHDGPVWADDSVEVFLDAQGTRYSYYHFIVNAAGVLYDAYNKEPNRGDAAWDSGAIAAGRLLADGYSVEMIIPWTSLDLGLNRTGTIGLNLCRNIRYTVGRQSLFGQYHSPTTWQEFHLDQTGPKGFPVSAEEIEWSPLAGKNEVIARFRNLTQAPVQLSSQLVVAQGNQRQENAVRLAIAAGDAADFRMPYRVTDQETAHFRLALQDAGGKEILTAYRILQPRPLATVSMDTDVLLRGENPVVTVSLAVSKASAEEYAFLFSIHTPDGKEVFRREVLPSPRSFSPRPGEKDRTRFEATLDLSGAPTEVSHGAPRDANRLEIETTVTNVRVGKEVFRGTTPIRLVSSPWTGEGG